MSDVLFRDTLEAWRRYRATGKISATHLRPLVYRAWERSHIDGANPLTLKAEKLSSLETERLLEQQSYLIGAARPYLRILSQAAGAEHHAVMLSEHNAIVLDVVGDEQSVHGPESVPGPGSLLSEGLGGANGIGTPLAENGYAEILGSEHFIEGFHPFTCQGIPLRNDQCEVIGALSISVRRAEVGQRLKEILICASHGIEAEFTLGRLQEAVRCVLTSNTEDSKPLENLRQDIVQAYSGARLRLEATSGLLAKNRFEYAMKLIGQANELIDLFRHRATCWQDLASLELGVIQPLSLTNTVRDLVDILSTEATIRKVEIVTNLEEEVKIEGDKRSLLRSLFKDFLQALDMAGSGGAILVKVETIPHSISGKVCLIPIPAPNNLQLAPVPFVCIYPKREH